MLFSKLLRYGVNQYSKIKFFNAMFLCPPGHRPLQKYFSQTTRLHVLDCRQLNKVGISLPSKQTKKISVRTVTNRNKICLGLFHETKHKKFRFVSVFWTYIETTETNRTDSKHILVFFRKFWIVLIQNFLKNTKIWSLSNCFGWSTFCFVSIETSILSVSLL